MHPMTGDEDHRFRSLEGVVKQAEGDEIDVVPGVPAVSALSRFLERLVAVAGGCLLADKAQSAAGYKWRVTSHGSNGASPVATGD
jgi:hypothetical protein